MNPLAELLGIEEEYPTRKCRRCQVSKPLNAFEINSYGSQKFHRKICKQCRDTQQDSKKVAIIKKCGTAKLIRPPEGTRCECCNIAMSYGQKNMNSMCFDHVPFSVLYFVFFFDLTKRVGKNSSLCAYLFPFSTPRTRN